MIPLCLATTVVSLPGLDQVRRKFVDGLKSVDEFLVLIKARCHIEENYAKQLRKLSQLPLENAEDAGTLQDALGGLRSDLINKAVQHQELARNLMQDVHSPLQDIRTSYASSSRAPLAKCQGFLRDISSAEERYRASHRKFERAYSDAHGAVKVFVAENYKRSTGMPPSSSSPQTPPRSSLSPSHTSRLSLAAFRSPTRRSPRRHSDGEAEGGLVKGLRAELSSERSLDSEGGATGSGGDGGRHGGLVGWLLPSREGRRGAAAAAARHAVEAAEDARTAALGQWEGFRAVLSRQLLPLQSALTELQALEEQRATEMRECLRRHCVFESSAFANQQYDLQMLARVMEDVRPPCDLGAFTRTTAIAPSSLPFSLPPPPAAHRLTLSDLSSDIASDLPPPPAPPLQPCDPAQLRLQLNPLLRFLPPHARLPPTASSSSLGGGHWEPLQRRTSGPLHAKPEEEGEALPAEGVAAAIAALRRWEAEGTRQSDEAAAAAVVQAAGGVGFAAGFPGMGASPSGAGGGRGDGGGVSAVQEGTSVDSVPLQQPPQHQQQHHQQHQQRRDGEQAEGFISLSLASSFSSPSISSPSLSSLPQPPLRGVAPPPSAASSATAASSQAVIPVAVATALWRGCTPLSPSRRRRARSGGGSVGSDAGLALAGEAADEEAEADVEALLVALFAGLQVSSEAAARVEQQVRRSASGRWVLLAALERQRAVSCVLLPAQFAVLTLLLRAAADTAERDRDGAAARVLLLLCAAFYCVTHKERVAVAPGASTAAARETRLCAGQHEQLWGHALWRGEALWAEAVGEGAIAVEGAEEVSDRTTSQLLVSFVRERRMAFGASSEVPSASAAAVAGGGEYGGSVCFVVGVVDTVTTATEKKRKDEAEGQ